jgi:hypothetical protein
MNNPTLKEQMDWLDLIKGLLHSDNAPMILAIKENLIAVRNMEVSIERELDKVHPQFEKAFNDLLERGEAIIDFKTLGMTPPSDKDILEFFERDGDTGDTMKLELPKDYVHKMMVKNAEERIGLQPLKNG